MKKNPFFSIIIPVYNVAPYLRECLDSVLNQTFTDWEAICVDDGSTDESGRILDEYEKVDKRFIVIHQINHGVSVARNLGINKASGKWLMFLDGDDVYLERSLEKVHLLVITYKSDCFICDSLYRFDEALKKRVFATGNLEIIKKAITLEERYSLLLDEPRLDGYSFLRIIKRSVFGHITFPDRISIMEDTVHLLRTMFLDSEWAIVNLQIYGYRRRNDSATGNKLSNKILLQVPLVNRHNYLFCKRKFRMRKSELKRYAKTQAEFNFYCINQALHTCSGNLLRSICFWHIVYFFTIVSPVIFSRSIVSLMMSFILGRHVKGGCFQ